MNRTSHDSRQDDGPRRFELSGKVALVTGGNTGIGRATCVAFAEAGADVAIGWFADEAAADSLVEAVEALGRRALAVQLDVTSEVSVDGAVEATLFAFGRLDVLVNNAGIQRSASIADTTLADFEQMWRVHVLGAYACARAVAPHMRSRGSGRIINVCSQLGYIGRADYAAYSSAKGALIALTRALARELAPHGILVNGVSPGLVDTGFDPLPDDAKQAHAASLPMQRLGTPEDMTSAFVFLASDAGRYYCGQMLHPNGGEIMP